MPFIDGDPSSYGQPQSGSMPGESLLEPEPAPSEGAHQAGASGESGLAGEGASVGGSTTREGGEQVESKTAQGAVAEPPEQKGAVVDGTALPDNALPTGPKYTELTREELLIMSSRDENYRKPIKNGAERRKAHERARLKGKLAMITDGDQLMRWNETSVEKIAEVTQSVGLELYFMFLRGGAFYFGLWSLLMLFLFLCCASPSGTNADEDQGVAGLAIFSLGSFGQTLESSPTRTVNFLGWFTFTAKNVTPWLSVMSAAGAFLYFMYVVRFLHIKIRKEVARVDEAAITPAGYTLIVENLPSFELVPSENYGMALRRHLGKVLQHEKMLRVEVKEGEEPPEDEGPYDDKQLLEVFPEVHFARDYQGSLYRKMQEAAMQVKIVEAKIDEDDAALKKLEAQAKKLHQYDEADEKQHIEEEDRKIFRAYVSCQRESDKDVFEDAYRLSGTLLGYLFQSSRHRFEGKRISVQAAPEPSNILWENQDCTPTERIRRKCTVRVLVLLLLAVSTAGILWSQQSQQEMAEDAKGMSCPDEMYVPDLLPAEEEPLEKESALAYLSRLPHGTKLENHFTDCQCAQIGLANLQDGDLKKACADFVYEQNIALVITAASSVVVIGLNFVLKTLLVALAAYERPLTISGLEQAIAKKVFVALFLNTAVIVFILNLAFQPPMDEFLRGHHEDFSHYWYATVGLAVSTTMAVNVLSPHVISVVVAWVGQFKACFCGSCCLNTEDSLVTAYDPPPFELAPRCGALLNTIFSTMFFAAGCPILIFFAFFNHVLCYVCDKYVLLACSKRPPAYDAGVINSTLSFVPIAMLLHALAGIWMFGNDAVFPSDDFLDWDLDTTGVPQVLVPLVTAAKRAFVAAGFPYFLLLLAIGAYLGFQILKFTLGNAFAPAEQALAVVQKTITDAFAARRMSKITRTTQRTLRDGDLSKESGATIRHTKQESAAPEPDNSERPSSSIPWDTDLDEELPKLQITAKQEEEGTADATVINEDDTSGKLNESPTWMAAKEIWKTSGMVGSYNIHDNEKYNLRQAAEIDWRHFAMTGEVCRKQKKEANANAKEELSSKEDVASSRATAREEVASKQGDHVVDGGSTTDVVDEKILLRKERPVRVDHDEVHGHDDHAAFEKETTGLKITASKSDGGSSSIGITMCAVDLGNMSAHSDEDHHDEV